MSDLSPSKLQALKALLNKSANKDQLENKLKRWASPPSETETEKCERAVRMVKRALDANEKLSKEDITVFPKGSFHNRTSIPSDSDVDVGVRINTLFRNDYPEGMSKDDFGFEPATYTFTELKQDVTKALINYFGKGEVTVGNKAILIHSNTVRVDADVVPHMVHRRYHKDGSYVEGVALTTSDGKTIYNWPDQDYRNAVNKNDNTSRQYKAMVRIIKNLRGEMQEKGYRSADKAASYLIACLVWNIPDYYFNEETYIKMVEDCLIYLKDKTSDLVNVKEWGEVNELKYLFRTSQPWKLEDVHKFVSDAIEYFKGLNS